MKKIALLIVSMLFFLNCWGQDSLTSAIKDFTVINEKNEVNTKKKDNIDWNFIFQLIAAIGSLSTFGAFVFLFLKDKNKQAQIDKLSSIAMVLEEQNEKMVEQNSLVSQQVEILRNISFGETNNKEIEKLRSIEEAKLKLSVKPNLWLNGAGYDPRGELKIDLNNKGEDAKLLEFILKSDDIELHSEHLPYDLDKGERRYIFGRTKGEKHIKDCKYRISVIYSDKLDNKYEVIIEGVGAHVKIIETKEL